jgi:hypothetical protein
LTKKEHRQKVFEKYGGRCAYCGCELQKGWHVDEVEPCRRKYRIEKGHWLRISDKRKMTISDMSELSEADVVGKYKWVEEKTVFDGYEHPERLHLDNQMPACASCNINKHSMGLEEFRKTIAGYLNSLNLRMVQYKMAKKYGLVVETNQPVEFFFEKEAIRNNCSE